MNIDSSYAQKLSGLDAWPLFYAALVALGVPLGVTPKSDRVRYRQATELHALLARGVKAGTLPVVSLREPEPERFEDRYPRASRQAFGEGARMFGSVSVGAPKRVRIAAKTFEAWATVRPLAVAEWLRKSGLHVLADEVERVAGALHVPAPAAAPAFEQIESGDEPRNLSKASPEDVDAWIAAQWAAAAKSKATKGFGEVLVRKLQAGGFSKKAARVKHTQTVPAKHSRGRKGARSAP